MFFFGVKKEPKNLWGDADPKPRRPWRSGARGQQKTKRKRILSILGTKSFSFAFLFFVLHKHKTNVKCEMNLRTMFSNT